MLPVGYDEATGKLTIEIHGTILRRADQQNALAVKAIEIFTEGPSVESVEYVPREGT